MDPTDTPQTSPHGVSFALQRTFQAAQRLVLDRAHYSAVEARDQLAGLLRGAVISGIGAAFVVLSWTALMAAVVLLAGRWVPVWVGVVCVSLANAFAGGMLFRYGVSLLDGVDTPVGKGQPSEDGVCHG